jgi:hypothetical protein
VNHGRKSASNPHTPATTAAQPIGRGFSGGTGDGIGDGTGAFGG